MERKFWVWLFCKNMKDAFNERLPYSTHFVFLHPILGKPQILLTFISHPTLMKKNLMKYTITGLRLLATERLLEIIKNAFYFTLKALFVLKIFKFSSWLFAHVAKPLDKKVQVNFKFYDVAVWLISSRNTHIAQYFDK